MKRIIFSSIILTVLIFVSCKEQSLEQFLQAENDDTEFKVTAKEFINYFESIPEEKGYNSKSATLELTPSFRGNYNGKFICNDFGPCKKCNLLKIASSEKFKQNSILGIDCYCADDHNKPNFFLPTVPNGDVTSRSECKLSISSRPFQIYCNDQCCDGNCRLVRIPFMINDKKGFRISCACKALTACPDLVVDQIFDPIWDKANQKTIINITIKNIGHLTAIINLARLIDSSTLQGSGTPQNDLVETPALLPGASATLTFRLPYNIYNPDAQFEVTADYKRMITECNENNNQRGFFEEG